MSTCGGDVSDATAVPCLGAGARDLAVMSDELRVDLVLGLTKIDSLVRDKVMRLVF
jgi:hypothetical protein